MIAIQHKDNGRKAILVTNYDFYQEVYGDAPTIIVTYYTTKVLMNQFRGTVALHAPLIINQKESND